LVHRYKPHGDSIWKSTQTVMLTRRTSNYFVP
jgi:hypothetical protein